MIGASRETVSRAMSDFQEAGMVTVARRRISVADREALEKRAQARV
jgi:CRP/FNR family cyclic AMP-dependent transcriptional regulator